MKYYSLDRILAKNCDYNFIFSGRGPGKSTAMVNHLIDEFFQNDAEFVRIGRYDWEVSRTLMSNWFNTVNYRKLIDYTNNDEVLVKFEGGQWAPLRGREALQDHGVYGHPQQPGRL